MRFQCAECDKWFSASKVKGQNAQVCPACRQADPPPPEVNELAKQEGGRK